MIRIASKFSEVSFDKLRMYEATKAERPLTFSLSLSFLKYQASRWAERPFPLYLSFIMQHSSFLIRHSSFVIRHSSFLLLLLCLTACYAPPQRIILDATEEEAPADSLASTLVRPYGVGYNMIVDADSLLLVEDRPMHWSGGVGETSDSLWLRRYDALVIAALTVIPEDSVDSVWVKVARDQLTMGWLHESQLLESARPDDPISAFIRVFSNRHLLWFLVVLAAVIALVGLRLVRRQRFAMVHFADIPSAYPVTLLLTLAALALLYGYIQRAAPQLWVQFYFHPTLNPLAQPPLLCVFLAGLWLVLLLAIASVDNVFSLLRPVEALFYLFTLLGASMMVYLVFSLTAHTLLGYALFAAYAFVSIRHFWRCSRPRYLCGQCGAKLHDKGRCPHCGAIND